MLRGAVVWRWLFGLAVAVQLVVVYAPSTGVGGDVAYADKLVHGVVFAVVVWTGRGAGLPVVPLAAAAAGHAVLSEIVQATVLPRRSGDAWDVLADVVGVAIGAVLPVRNRPRAGNRRDADDGSVREGRTRGTMGA